MTAAAYMRAMVLAAGKGTRMGALSDQVPKPMVPVAGRTLIDRILDHLAQAGVARAVVNVHHKADMLERHLAAHVAAGRVVISDERDRLLETGGGVKKAIPLLGSDPFFVINSDALWTDGTENTLDRLAGAFDPARMDVLLLLVRREDALGYDGKGDFLAEVRDDAPVPLIFRGEAPTAPVMFGGVQIVSPEMYADRPDGVWSNLDIFRAAAANGRLYGLLHTGAWMHVGTPDAIGEAEAKLKELGKA